jgi:hypothetical protein
MLSAMTLTPSEGNKMKLIIASILALTATVATAETIPGGHALPCTDTAAFVLVPGTNYYNNPTCSAPDGGTHVSACQLAGNCDDGDDEEPTDVASK